MKTAVAIAAMLLWLETTAPEPVPVKLPAGAIVEQVTLTADGTRGYYTTATGDLWWFDTTGKNQRIATGSIWDVTLSAMRNAVAYTKADDRRQQHVWIVPLDPTTGQPSAAERRVSATAGDVPAIAPDGRSLAFARDDSSGVGQSIIVLPIGGGTERVVAGSLPSSIGSLRWTPDGHALVFGVNPPVPFTCAESCLSIPGGTPRVPGTIRRVAASGGQVTIITSTGKPWPGLSPDGTKLAFVDRDDPRKLVIADAGGTPLKTITLEPTQTLQGWFSGDRLLSCRQRPIATCVPYP